jgi:hypothetical protein
MDQLRDLSNRTDMLCRVPRSLPTHVLLMLSRDTQPSKSITVPARSARLAYMMFALFFCASDVCVWSDRFIRRGV